MQTFPLQTSSWAFVVKIFLQSENFFMQKSLIVLPSYWDYLLWEFALMSPLFFSSLQSYLDKSSVMFSSLMPPNTLNFFRLQTWVFSYFPKVMLWTTAGLSSFKTKNWRKDRRGEQTWWINMWLLCVQSFCSCGSLKLYPTLVPFLRVSFFGQLQRTIYELQTIRGQQTVQVNRSL